MVSLTPAEHTARSLQRAAGGDSAVLIPGAWHSRAAPSPLQLTAATVRIRRLPRARRPWPVANESNASSRVVACQVRKVQRRIAALLRAALVNQNKSS